METRFLLVKRGCAFCRQMIKVINKMNTRLQIDKKIQIIDCWEYEEFGWNNIPISEKFIKDGLSQGYPFLYIDGVVVNPAPTPEQMEIFLETFLKDDLLYLNRMKGG